MPEPVIYMRGLRPPFAEAIAENSAMLADLRTIAGLADAQVADLKKRLAEATGFLDPRGLANVVRSVIADAESASAVHRALRNLPASEITRLLAALEDAEQKGEFPFDSETIDRLRNVLSALIQPYPAIVRYEKAERLATLTGQELESIELICDLRPVFDENRKTIEGMMPYTRMRIVATGADGLPNAFEAELSQQQVHDLADKASKAKDKLLSLREHVLDWNPNGLPELPLIRSLTKDLSDA